MIVLEHCQPRRIRIQRVVFQLLAQLPNWLLVRKHQQRNIPQRKVENRTELCIDAVPALVTANEESRWRRIAFEYLSHHPQLRILPVKSVAPIADKEAWHV